MDGPSIGSLCTGYGGLDTAVRAVLGGRVVWHAETDPDAVRVLEHHHPGTLNLGDITAVDWAAVERPDILTAGFPCQGWSDAGLRLGVADARDLWPAVAAAVRALRPGLVVLENVRGFVRRGVGRTYDDLAGLGYDFRGVCVPASEAGAPHRRERWFAVAYRSGDAGRLKHGDRGVAA